MENCDPNSTAFSSFLFLFIAKLQNTVCSTELNCRPKLVRAAIRVRQSKEEIVLYYLGSFSCGSHHKSKNSCPRGAPHINLAQACCAFLHLVAKQRSQLLVLGLWFLFNIHLGYPFNDIAKICISPFNGGVQWVKTGVPEVKPL